MGERGKKIVNLAPNESLPNEGIIKLQNFYNNEKIGSFYYRGEEPNWGGEKSFSYGAIWVENEKVYELDLATFEKLHLEKQKEVFELILSTFKFLN